MAKMIGACPQTGAPASSPRHVPPGSGGRNSDLYSHRSSAVSFQHMKVPSRSSLLVLCIALILAGAASGIGAEGGDATTGVQFSAPGGWHDNAIELTLTTRIPGTEIRFTTNGAPPTRDFGQAWNRPWPIHRTTVLRAAAFLDGQRVTDIATRTFLYSADVLKQTGAGAPATWGTNNGALVPADYEMDPEIVNHPAYRDELPPALRALPAIAVTLDPPDLWDPARGIYSNPRQTGDTWERPASVEWLPGAGTNDFQINCGIRIQGGWNRRPEESPKHAFRLAFRKQYGPGRLRHPLFPGAGATEFQSLILRAGCNNTWLHWSGEERRRGDYLRDQWMRETYAAMGRPSARGRFVHLFLNGLYWGLYNLVERPDEHFAAAHLGGKPRDLDARNADNLLAGDDTAWRELFRLANAGLREPAAYAAATALLDIDAFIDFILLNLYGANGDWDRASNWYAARPRQPPGPFTFFIWDGERTLEDPEASVLPFDDDLSPPRLFHRLRENAAFRARFAGRARHHLATVLAPEPAAQRLRALAATLDSAILAESARWGDYRRDAHPYKTGPYELHTRHQHWRPEIQRLLTEYFPKRPAPFARQLRDAQLLGTDE